MSAYETHANKTRKDIPIFTCTRADNTEHCNIEKQVHLGRKTIIKTNTACVPPPEESKQHVTC